MSIIDDYQYVTSKTFGELIGSPDVLKLLKLYSKLFLNNQSPAFCEKCLNRYYTELKNGGVELVYKYNDMINRTLVPAWNGIKTILGMQYDSNTITDKEAILYLNRGSLRESHFKKLPDGYEPKVKATNIADVVTDIAKVQQTIKKTKKNKR